MKDVLSASGARIRGDDYQHLLALIEMLRAYMPNSGISFIGIEDPEVKGADDVTVYKENGDSELFQAKSAVDARGTANTEWLTEPSKAGGSSILQKLYEAWVSGTATGQRVGIVLVTNRPLLADDAILECRDGRDGTVAKRLCEAPANGANGKARKSLAEHLSTDEQTMLTFLENVSFRIGKLYDELAKEAEPLMFACGLICDSEAVKKGVSIVHNLVTEGTRKISADEIRKILQGMKAAEERPYGTFLVQAIESDSSPENATVALNWVDQFEGDDPRSRRQLKNPDLWNTQCRSEIRSAVKTMRGLGFDRVLVRGFMRLPTWFTIGVDFGKTAGFEVSSLCQGTPWSAWGDRTTFPLDINVGEKVGHGTDIAIGIALATDPTPDVMNYIQGALPDVGRYVCIRPTNGPSNAAIKSPAGAREWAYGVRDAVREIVREHGSKKIHLFLAAPAGATLLLGHLWDRLPLTQLYEDLGSGNGYAPSYLIAN